MCSRMTLDDTVTLIFFPCQIVKQGCYPSFLMGASTGQIRGRNIVTDVKTNRQGRVRES